MKRRTNKLAEGEREAQRHLPHFHSSHCAALQPHLLLLEATTKTIILWCLCVCVCLHECIFACACDVHLCACMRVCVFVCICVCICVTHTHIHNVCEWHSITARRVPGWINQLGRLARATTPSFECIVRSNLHSDNKEPPRDVWGLLLNCIGDKQTTRCEQRNRR